MVHPPDLERLLTSKTPASHGFRPSFYQLPADHAALKELLDQDPHLEVHDHLHAQLRELLKSLHPSVKFTSVELEEAIANHLNGSRMLEYGTWVHYPWSNTLVHLLGEQEFAWVRTDRNRNKITREEQAVLARKKVGVIGLSVGQSVSLTMALERTFGEIRLADFDTLDLSNLNRIRTGTRNLGMNKAVVTAREIAEIDPYLHVTCFTEGLTVANMDAFFTEGGKLDILVEECDSVDIKILARQKAKELGIPVVMDMSDRGCLDVERFDLEPERPILHGCIDHLDLEAAKRPMSAEEKVPYMLPITGVETLSARMKASVIELGRSISTWPQLATSVVLGGALAGDAVRRIALGQFHASGRWHVDLEELVADPIVPSAPPVPPPIPMGPSTKDLQRLDQLPDPGDEAAMDLDQRTVGALVEAGGQAPSAGNMQPWKFLWRGKRLWLFHDLERSRSMWDPDHLLAHLALGACVENIVLKAHELGLEAVVGPGPGHLPTLFAQFTFSRNPSVECEPHAWDHLAPVIGLRSTYRALGGQRPLPQAIKVQLDQAACSGTVRSHWIEGEAQLQQFMGLVAQMERLRMMHPAGHREFYSKWLQLNGSHDGLSGAGVQLRALALPPMAEAAMKVMADPKAMDLLRTWNGGQAIGLLPALHLGSSSAVALFSMPTGTQADARRSVGRALQRFWLTASHAGWGVQPLFAPIYVARALNANPGHFDPEEAATTARVDRELRQLFALVDEEPVCLLRLAEPVGQNHRSPRNAIMDITVHADQSSNHY
ncbi:MAG: Rv1355c family protein [Flavobacteriales bacterium]|nr:Rv1355c family protein [Flavobacteriales bacterium]MBP9081214.1 Rv1355c family protein [Flavobacteriales bacterium]